MERLIHPLDVVKSLIGITGLILLALTAPHRCFQHVDFVPIALHLTLDTSKPTIHFTTLAQQLRLSIGRCHLSNVIEHQNLGWLAEATVPKQPAPLVGHWA